MKSKMKYVWAILVLGLFYCPLSEQQTPIKNETSPAKPLQVCTLDRPPMAFCDVAIPSTQYTGLSLEIFRQAASVLEAPLKEGTDYEFKCLTDTTGNLMLKLSDPKQDECDLAIASITITSERQDLGVLFAYPYYSSWVSVMVGTDKSPATGWAWVEPFSPNMWIAILVTMLIWPLLIFLIEAYSLKPNVKVKDVYYGVEESTWRSLWALQHGNCMDVYSLGARFAVLTFAFFALIIGSSYTANLAAFLTSRRVNSVNSIYDLGGLAVSSVPVYIPRLRTQYGIIASDANVSDINDVQATAELVAMGNLKGFCYDNVVSQYVAATFPGCAVKLLPDKIQPFDYGLAFKAGTNASLVDSFSEAILRVQESGYVGQLDERFLLSSSPCITGGSSINEDNDRISFESVYGLWVILLSGLVVGAAIMLFVRRQNAKRWREIADRAQSNSISMNGNQIKDPTARLQKGHESALVDVDEIR